MNILKKVCLLFSCLAGVLPASAQHYKNVDAIMFTSTKLQPGTTQDIEFTLYLFNSDLEYGDSLAIEFFPGVKPNGSPNNPLAPTSEGQAPEAYNGVSGDTLVSWGDNNDSLAIGGIEPGKYISFKINVTVDDTVTHPKQVRYFVSGDKLRFASGGLPKDHEDTILIGIQPPLADLDLSFTNPVGEMYKSPLNQLGSLRLYAEVINRGGKLEENTAVVFADEAGTFFSSEQVPELESGDTARIVSQVDLLPTPGMDYKLRVYLTNTADADFSNNSDSVLFSVTDSVMSREDGSKTGKLSLTGTGEIGTWLKLNKADTLTSISVYLDDPQRNDSLRVAVYAFNTTPGALIARSEAHVISSFIVLPGWYHIFFPDTVVIDSGEFFIAAEQLIPGRLDIGTTSFNYYPNSNYVRPTAGGWEEAGSFGPAFQENLLMRANFSTPKPKSTVGIGTNKPGLIELSPNPVRDRLVLKGSGGFFRITDISGKEILNGNISRETIMVDTLAPGMYILHINGSQVRFVKE